MEYEKIMKEFSNIKNEYPELNIFLFKTSYGKKTLGYCSPFGKKKYISLSYYLMNGASDEKVIETLRHECAHALDYLETGTTDHGPNWKKWCVELGIEPNRLSRDTWEEGKKPKSKYTLTCPTCGKTSTRHKMTRSSFTDSGYREYSCGKCSGGKFNREHLLEVTVNY